MVDSMQESILRWGSSGGKHRKKEKCHYDTKSLDELLSGKLSFRTRVRYYFDPYKKERKKIARALKEIVGDMARRREHYEDAIITDPFAYKLDSGNYISSITDGEITLNHGFVINSTDIDLKDVILHENLHAISNKRMNERTTFSVFRQSDLLLNASPKGKAPAFLKNSVEECLYRMKNKDTSHSLYFFRLSEYTGLQLPDIYTKCDSCKYEAHFSFPPERSKNDRLILCDHCEKPIVEQNRLLRYSVIFVNLDSLNYKSMQELALSALLHPFNNDPAALVVKKESLYRLANYYIAPRF